MKNEDMFQMRQLKDSDLEEFNALLRYVFQVTGDELLSQAGKKMKSSVQKHQY